MRTKRLGEAQSLASRSPRQRESQGARGWGEKADFPGPHTPRAPHPTDRPHSTPDTNTHPTSVAWHLGGGGVRNPGGPQMGCSSFHGNAPPTPAASPPPSSPTCAGTTSQSLGSQPTLHPTTLLASGLRRVCSHLLSPPSQINPLSRLPCPKIGPHPGSPWRWRHCGPTSHTPTRPPLQDGRPRPAAGRGPALGKLCPDIAAQKRLPTAATHCATWPRLSEGPGPSLFVGGWGGGREAR